MTEPVLPIPPDPIRARPDSPSVMEEWNELAADAADPAGMCLVKAVLGGVTYKGRTYRQGEVFAVEQRVAASYAEAGQVEIVKPPAQRAPSPPPAEADCPSEIPVAPTPPTGIKQSAAIWSFVVGLLGILCPLFRSDFSAIFIVLLLKFCLGIVAVVLGHYALSLIRDDPAIYGGKKKAIAGLVLGYLMVLGFIGILINLRH